MEERTRIAWREVAVHARGATLAAQTTDGGEGDVPLLLLGGATWSRDWWPDELCAALVAQGASVVRFDARDTGASTSSPPGAPDYDAEDLADDAVAVLDACGVDRAVVLGCSMGGGLAQLVAGRSPERVAGLVVLSSAPAGPVGRPLDAAVGGVVDPSEPDWDDADEVVDWIVAAERAVAGTGALDEPMVRAIARRAVARTPSLEPAAANHLLVAASGPSVELDALRGIPALVVHGAADPVFPAQHGEALAATIGASFLLLDDVGHGLPPRTAWPLLVPRIGALLREAGGRMQPQRRSIAVEDGATISVLNLPGTSPAVVLLHGLAGSATELLPTARALGGRRAVLVDQRGHGESTRRPADVRRAAFVADVVRVIEAETTSPVDLVGHSMGAHTAMLVAAVRPDLVRRLVLLEGTEGGGTREEREELGAFLRSWRVPFPSRDAASAALGGGPLAEAWAADLEASDGGLRPRFDADVMVAILEHVEVPRWEEWAAVQAPTLVVFAEHGMFTAAQQARFVAHGRDVARADLPGASHDAHLDAHDAWACVLRAFLDAP
ncbi:hypothetical protein GCM10009846_13520 [Agrococcus versicolor]|uniref:AB hydrolase-1 domain-containing protein n=1 Tax=Agrococcus versicolor TaxID=501482 RepID=A0ABP5MHL0_9MICO